MDVHVLTTTPRNTVAVSGTGVVLTCGIENRNASVQLQWHWCTPNCSEKKTIYNGLTVGGDIIRDYNLAFLNDSYKMDLIITNTQSLHAGTYDCSSGSDSETPTAQLVVIGMYFHIF